MSLTIGTNKLRFVIFGNGHDSARNDSGDGMTSFLYECDYCAFDTSGQYCWVVTKHGDPADRKIRKLDTATWEEVPHAFENVDVSTEVTSGFLCGIENTNSNLGILVLGSSQIVVFDLTTDTIAYTISGNLFRINEDYPPHATLVGDKIRIIGASVDQSKVDAPYAVLDLTNLTVTQNNQSGGWTISGFYNDTDITFANRTYGDHRAIWGAHITDGGANTLLWDNFSLYNTDVQLESFSHEDDLYFPTLVGDEWRFGKYPIPPDLNTPTPQSYIGINANTLASPPVYTRGRTWASFLMTDNSLMVTDFVNTAVLYNGSSPKLTPMVMGDHLIICAGSDGHTYLARYR